MDEAEWGDKPLAPFSIAPLDVNKPKEEPEPAKSIIGKEYTEEYKRKYWNKFIKRITPLENDLKRNIIKLFQEQELRALRALRSNKSINTKNIDDVLRITHDEKEIMKFVEVILPRITEMVRINGTAAYAELGVEGAFDVTNPAVIKWIKKHTGESIKSILDTTFDALKRTLAEGVENGDSITKLADRITKEYKDCKGYKATRIARTETSEASNQGAVKAYEQSGVVKLKEWLAEDDACEICLPLNGTKARLSGSFEGGYSAPPAHPSCRCTILPVIPKD